MHSTVPGHSRKRMRTASQRTRDRLSQSDTVTRDFEALYRFNESQPDWYGYAHECSLRQLRLAESCEAASRVGTYCFLSGCSGTAASRARTDRGQDSIRFRGAPVARHDGRPTRRSHHAMTEDAQIGSWVRARGAAGARLLARAEMDSSRGRSALRRGRLRQGAVDGRI